MTIKYGTRHLKVQDLSGKNPLRKWEERRFSAGRKIFRKGKGIRREKGLRGISDFFLSCQKVFFMEKLKEKWILHFISGENALY